MSILRKLFKIRFFKTKKEKVFIIREMKKGNIIPFFIYILYLFRMSSFIIISRKHYKIRLSYSPYALWLYFHKERKRKEEEFVVSYLEEGDTMLDCGAHLATVTLTASYVVRECGHVYAFEAHPSTYLYAKKNIKLAKYHNITLRHLAVSDKKEIVKISSEYVSDMNHIGEKGSKVYANSLQEIVEDFSIKEINLLKIDVEGMEYKTLIGAEKIFYKVHAILFESAFASFERYGFTLYDIIHLLKKHGYTVYRFLGDDPLLIERIENTYKTKTRYEDLLALNDVGRIRFQKKQGKILFS